MAPAHSAPPACWLLHPLYRQWHHYSLSECGMFVPDVGALMDEVDAEKTGLDADAPSWKGRPPKEIAEAAEIYLELFETDLDEESAILTFIECFGTLNVGYRDFALIDLLQLPVVGLEEDAADQFATLAVIALDGPWYAYSGAILFRALAEDRGGPGAADYWDEHALHEQRDTNILCWLYGHDPDTFAFVAGRFPDAADRLQRCGAEYRQIRDSWAALLDPHETA